MATYDINHDKCHNTAPVNATKWYVACATEGCTLVGIRRNPSLVSGQWSTPHGWLKKGDDFFCPACLQTLALVAEYRASWKARAARRAEILRERATRSERTYKHG